MKKSYFVNKVLKFSLALFFAVSLLGLVASCKDDENDEQFEDVTLQFVVDTEDDVVVNNVITQIGTNQSSNFNVNDDSWESAPQVINTSVGAVHLAANGAGSGSDSKMILRILINGEVAAEQEVTGSGMIQSKAVVAFPVVNDGQYKD